MSKKKKKSFEWMDMLEDYSNEKADVYVLYLRRSRKRKNKKGKVVADEPQSRIDSISIEQQREACSYIAKERGLKIVKTFEEELPAKDPDKRPEFKNMLEYVSSSSENIGILSWHPDRLSRNAIEGGILIQMFVKKAIIDFQFVTYHFNQDETGVEYLMMEFARAMGYSLRLRKNVRRGMLSGYHKEGEWQFTPKFGYDRLLVHRPNVATESVNFLVPYEVKKDGLMSEFEAIQMAFRLRTKGITLKEIAKQINSTGYLSKAGSRGTMTKQKLSTYLRDTFYIGLATSAFGPLDLREDDKYAVDGSGEIVRFVPAVGEEDFYKCQRINDEKTVKKKRSHPELPFRDLIRCGYCNEFLTAQGKEKKRKKYVYYYCQNENCNGRGSLHGQTLQKISGAKLFPKIKQILEEGFKLSRKEFTFMLGYLEKQNQMKKQMRKTDLKSLSAVKGHLESKMKKSQHEHAIVLSKAIREGLPQATLTALSKQHADEMQQFEEEIKTAQEKERMILKSQYAWTHDLERWLEHTAKAYQYWDNATLEQKLVIAENIFLELTVKDEQISSYSYKEPYASCKIVDLSLDGGPSWI